MGKERIILGIDPGTTIMGFGLIRVVNKQMEFIQMNELDLKKYSDHYVKLKLIFKLIDWSAALTEQRKLLVLATSRLLCFCP